MSSPTHPAVLIVGAGPAGLIAALSLAKHGVPVRIIEKSNIYQAGARGTGIQPRTLEIFANLGVLDPILAEGITNPRMRAYAPNGSDVAREWNFFEVTEPSPCVPYPNPCMVPQDRTEAIIRGSLQRLGVQVELGKELVGFEQDDEGVTAQIISNTPNASNPPETLRVGWLIGADGARGITRKALGLKLIGETRDDEGYIVIADLEAENLDRSCWQLWGTKGAGDGVALRPVTVASRCVLMSRVDAQDFVWESDLSKIQEHFNALSKRDDIKFTKVNWVSKWRPNIRMANKFSVGRVFIAGDAAHVHSPTGGQGMNSSVQDAYNLAWKLALAYKKLATPSLLSTYDIERMPVIAEMLNVSTQILDRYKSAGVTAAKAPEGGAASDPWTRGQKLRQLGVNCRWSPIVVDERTPAVEGEISDVYGLDGGDVVRAGDRAPDASGLIQIDGVELEEAATTTTLFGEFSSTAHTALIFSSTQLEEGSGALELLRKLAYYNTLAPSDAPLVQSIVVLPSSLGVAPHSRGDVGFTRKTLLDRDGHAYRGYAITGGGGDPTYVVIVRPDGTIGAIVEGPDGVEKYFSGVFGVAQ